MAKIRDILIDVAVTTAVRKRKCHRNAKHAIRAGEDFLSVREKSGFGSKNYCKECAQPILDLAKNKLSGITNKLS